MARIIVADDDELIRDLVSEKLRQQGHQVGVVSNGSEALNAIWAKRPDFVILDCNMPEVSGINVLRKVRQTPEFNHMLVMMLTGRRSPADEQIARFGGANAYLKKPFDPDELAFRVEDLLQAQDASRNLAQRS